MKRLFRYYLKLRKNIRLTRKLLRNKKKFVYAESFYPEKDRKSARQILKEQIRYIWKYGAINYQYFEYGADVVGVNVDDFIDNPSYKRRRERANNKFDVNYNCLVEDKNLFAIVGKYYGFPVWSSIGELRDGAIKTDQDRILDIHQVVDEVGNLFIKPVDGGGGIGTYKVHREGTQYFLNYVEMPIDQVCDKLAEISREGAFLVQRTFVQHKALSALYEKSVNTLRVVTVNPKYSDNASDVITVACILRIGANGMVVDNHGLGGLEILVDESGKLVRYAYYNPKFGTKITSHPDSKIVFEGYQIPFFEEAIDLCKRFHAKLNHLEYIGWDVAFSEEGVALFEANNKSGTKIQTFMGPLRKEFESIWIPNV